VQTQPNRSVKRRSWVAYSTTRDILRSTRLGNSYCNYRSRGLCSHAHWRNSGGKNGRNACTPDPKIGDPRSEGTEFTGLEQLLTKCISRRQGGKFLQSVIEALVSYLYSSRSPELGQ